MSRFGNLSINTKFNLIMSLLLVVLFVIAAFLTYSREQGLILKIAADNARILARQIIETRDYMSSVVGDEPAHNYALVPQVVATQVARKMTQDSDYYVRQVSLRYRNPKNRPDPYEAAQLERFASGPAHESYGVVTSEGKKVFRYMLPMSAKKSCLHCHGRYEDAPRFIQLRFPRGHYSYNYKIGQIIGAVSVSIPMADLYHDIGVNFTVDILVRGAVFLFVIVVLSALIRRTILTPIRTLSDSIVRVTETGDFSERIPVSSRDEVGQLINAFNEMMEELSHKTLQRIESDERYRRFIEISRSAVLTFLEDGKIVISNEKAEKLLAVAKSDLLGESIYSFLEDAEPLRRQIIEYLDSGTGHGLETNSANRIRNREGNYIDVEIALSASLTDHKPMFTAILRQLREKS